MAIKLTAESFLAVVKQSGLIDPDEMKRLFQEFKQHGVKLNDSRAIANEFVSHRALTRWQADKLLQGKHKGFFLGKYRLLSLLGKGGMSSVYLAEHIMMKRRCAIKVLPAKRVHDSSYLGRFLREAQAVANLDHPNIVRAYDVDKEIERETEIHFLVMEFVRGRSLQDIVVADGVFDVIDAVDAIRQGADGLEHAHGAGLVHRDIKPGNLLVDQQKIVKILDLGLAKFFNDEDAVSLTVAHDEKVLGTADYLAPEQALDSHKVDERADIYSLGCTFYFILTGHPPFTEGTLAQRLLAHQTKLPPSISQERPNMPGDLETIINKMMAKSLADRYQTAKEVSQALTHWLLIHAGDDWRLRNPALLGNGNSKRSTEDSNIHNESTSEWPHLNTGTPHPAQGRPAHGNLPQVLPVQAQPMASIDTTPNFANLDTQAVQSTDYLAQYPVEQGQELGTFINRLDSGVYQSGQTQLPETGQEIFYAEDGTAYLQDGTLLSHLPNTGVPVANAATATGEPVPLAQPVSTDNEMNSGELQDTSPNLKLLIGGVALAAVAGLMVFWLWPGSTAAVSPNQHTAIAPNTGQQTGNNGVLPAKLVVSPNGPYVTINQAIDAVRNQSQSRSSHTIEVTPGLYAERIVIDNSEQAWAEGLAIVCPGSTKSILAPTGDQPVIQLNKVRNLRIQGFHVQADNKKFGVQISGYLGGTTLENLLITGFQDVGLLGIEPNGFGKSAEVVVKNVIVQNGSPSAAGMQFTADQFPPSQVKLSEVQFIGPLATGILFSTDPREFEISDAKFFKTDAGIRFDKANLVLNKFALTRSTFYDVGRGIDFLELPTTSSLSVSSATFSDLIFDEVREAEALVRQGETSTFLTIVSRGKLANNWTSRPASASANNMELDLIQAKNSRLDDIVFESIAPQDGNFLKPPEGSPYRSAGSR